MRARNATYKCHQNWLKLTLQFSNCFTPNFYLLFRCVKINVEKGKQRPEMVLFDFGANRTLIKKYRELECKIKANRQVAFQFVVRL